MVAIKSNFEYDNKLKDPARHFAEFHRFLNEKYHKKYAHVQLTTWDDIARVEPKHIAEYIKASLSSFAKDFNSSQFDTQIAPKDLVIHDFEGMAEEEYMHVEKRERYDISARAIQGHAHEAHSGFRENGVRYSNTTTLDVITALETTNKFLVDDKPAFRVHEYQSRTQKWIDDIVEVFEDFFDNPKKYQKPVKLIGKGANAFARLGWMEGQPVNMLEVIRGFYFASQMDNFDLRQQIQADHNNKSVMLGGGACLAANLDEVKNYSASLTDYAHATYPRELSPLNYTPPKLREKVLAELGIVVEAPVDLSTFKEKEWTWEYLKECYHDKNRGSSKLTNMYVRSMRGCGVADDVAIVLASVLQQSFTNKPHPTGRNDAISRVIGATLADLVDTLEKDSAYKFDGGQDEAIGKLLSAKFNYACRNSEFREMFDVHRHASSDHKYPLISDAILKDFVAASANWPFTIHSSQRYFHLDVGGTCAINEYLKFLSNAFVQYNLNSDPAIHTPNEGYNLRAKLTFERIPVPKVIHEIAKRYSLVRYEETRSRKVGAFFSKMSEMHETDN